MVTEASTSVSLTIRTLLLRELPASGDPKSSVSPGSTVQPSSTPVPVRCAMSRGAGPPLIRKMKSACFAPEVVGLKTTETSRASPGGRVKGSN